MLTRSRALEVLRFLAAGGIATVTDSLIYFPLVHEGLDARAANLMSYSASACLAFLLHRTWTFAASRDAMAPQALRFTIMVGAGLLVSTCVIWTLLPLVGPLVAKAFAIASTVSLNYVAGRSLVFGSASTRGGRVTA